MDIQRGARGVGFRFDDECVSSGTRSPESERDTLASTQGSTSTIDTMRSIETQTEFIDVGSCKVAKLEAQLRIMKKALDAKDMEHVRVTATNEKQLLKLEAQLGALLQDEETSFARMITDKDEQIRTLKARLEEAEAERTRSTFAQEVAEAHAEAVEHENEHLRNRVASDTIDIAKLKARGQRGEAKTVYKERPGRKYTDDVPASSQHIYSEPVIEDVSVKRFLSAQIPKLQLEELSAPAAEIARRNSSPALSSPSRSQSPPPQRGSVSPRNQGDAHKQLLRSCSSPANEGRHLDTAMLRGGASNSVASMHVAVESVAAPYRMRSSAVEGWRTAEAATSSATTATNGHNQVVEVEHVADVPRSMNMFIEHCQQENLPSARMSQSLAPESFVIEGMASGASTATMMTSSETPISASSRATSPLGARIRALSPPIGHGAAINGPTGFMPYVPPLQSQPSAGRMVSVGAPGGSVQLRSPTGVGQPPVGILRSPRRLAGGSDGPRPGNGAQTPRQFGGSMEIRVAGGAQTPGILMTPRGGGGQTPSVPPPGDYWAQMIDRQQGGSMEVRAVGGGQTPGIPVTPRGGGQTPSVSPPGAPPIFAGSAHFAPTARGSPTPSSLQSPPDRSRTTERQTSGVVPTAPLVFTPRPFSSRVTTTTTTTTTTTNMPGVRRSPSTGRQTPNVTLRLSNGTV